MVDFNLSPNQWKRMPSWLAEPRYFWLFSIGILLASIFGDWIGAVLAPTAFREDRIRYSGWILDMLGLFVIADGISSKLDRFQGKGLIRFILENLTEWLKGFPLLKRESTANVYKANVVIPSPEFSAFARMGPNPNWTLEQKVEWLLEQRDEILKRVHTLEQRHERHKKLLSSFKSEIEDGVDEKIRRSHAKSAEIQVKDVGKEIVGLLWVVVGITFATVPEAIETSFSVPISWFESIGNAIMEFL